MVLAVGGILSCRKLWLWPQYWQEILTIWIGFDDGSAGAFSIGINLPQALHLAVLTPDGSLASLMV
jgi:hypothetical protein